MTNEQIKQHLLKAGVKNLIEFGYSEVNIENIMTDTIYSDFFKSMLQESKGKTKQIDEVINELLNTLSS